MLKPLRKIILTTLGILPMLVPIDEARAADASESSPDYLSSASELPWRKARLSLEMQTGTRTIGTLDAMIPFMGNDDFIVYADLMAKGATDNAFEGNLGLGVRRVNDAETAIWGAYAFYDVLKSVNNNQFTQVTVGLERLGLTWDFRTNAYLPIGKTKYVNTIYAGGATQIVDHNIIEYVQTQEEEVSAGGDIELGRTLGTNKVRGYLAAYTFGENLTGPRARVEYQMNSHVALNAAVQYDQTRKAQYFVGARFTIGGAKASNSDSIYARLTDPVVRDVDVVTRSTLTDDTQMAMDKFWMVDQTTGGTGGDGTINNPFGNIEDAINNAPEGAIIYVKGIDGKIYDAGTGTQLKSGQVLVGSAQDLYFDFQQNVAHFSASDNSLFLMGGNGIQSTISGTLIANSNVGIYNLNLMANDLVRGDAGITAANAQNVIIQNVNISGFHAENGSGISVSGNSQVSVTNFSVKNNYIGVDVDSSSFNVAGVLTIDQSQLAGLRTNNASVNASSIQITNSDQYGIFATGSASIITADTASITQGDISLDAAQLQIAHQLTINADQVLIENGGAINSDVANVTASNIAFNQSGSWTNNSGAVTINGTTGVGLWLQNNSQVRLGVAAISNAPDSIEVDSNSTLTFTDTLTTDHDVTINNATIRAINVNFSQGDLILNGGAFNVSQLLTANNIAINTGTLTANNITTQDLTITTNGTLSAKDVTANNIEINTSTLTANNITASGNVSINTGQLTAANSFILNADATHTLSIENGVLTAKIATINSGLMVLSNNGQLISNNASSSISVTNLTLNNSTVAIENGSLTVADSNADGITVKNGSTLQVNTLLTQHNTGNGIVVQDNGTTKNGSVINANTITSSSNGVNGIQQSGGQITTTGTMTLNANVNGFVQTGGSADIDTAQITGNTENGLNINNLLDGTFSAKKTAITDNAGVGVLLTQGTVQLSNVTITGNNQHLNQIVVTAGDNALAQRTLIIDRASEQSELNVISAGQVAHSSFADKDKAAILIDADATVNISYADISNNVGGYGIWVNAGTVILADSQLNMNQRAVILTQGDLTIKDSTMDGNTEYAVLVKDDDSKHPLTAAQRSITLENVSLLNTAKGDAGLVGAGYGLAVLGATTVQFDNSGLLTNAFQVKGNTAGGIYLANSDLTLTGVTIYNNIGNGIDVINDGAVILNITNSEIGNRTEGSQMGQQLIGVNIDAQQVNLTLDNVQITNNQADGLNVRATDNIDMTIQNGSELSNNNGAGMKSISDAGSVTLKITDGVINDNAMSGINIWAETQNITTAVDLTNVEISGNANGSSGYDAGIYIVQHSIATSIVNLDNVQIENNKYGVDVTHGILAGSIVGSTIQSNNLIQKITKEGDWENY